MRADKLAAAERVERESRRQARRDEEMRELAIKLRRKSVSYTVQNIETTLENGGLRPA